MAGELPILNLGRAQANARQIRDLASAVLSFAERHALVVRVTQSRDQLALELANALGLDAVVDGVV